MARLVRHSNDNSHRKVKLGSGNSVRDLHSFVQTHEFPLRLPKLSCPNSPERSMEAETVMLLSSTATQKLAEGKSKLRVFHVDMLKPHNCEASPTHGSPRNVRELPVDFGELMQYQQKRVLDRTTQSGSTSPPGSFWIAPFNRKDAELLVKWLDEMLGKLAAARDLGVSDLYKYAKGVYSVCLDETLLQIGAHCKEWGQLLERVWTAYFGLLEKAVDLAKVEIAKVESRSSKEQERLKSKYAVDIEAEQKKVAELTLRVGELSKEVKGFEKQLLEREDAEGTLRERTVLLEFAYEDTKTANLALKEEVRVLKNKLEEAITRIQEGQGESPTRKLRVKTLRELQAVVKADAFLQNNKGRTTAEKVIENAKLEQKLFALEDFADKAVGTDSGCMASVEIQTGGNEDAVLQPSRNAQTFLEHAQVHISEYQQVVRFHTEHLFAECRLLSQNSLCAGLEPELSQRLSKATETVEFVQKEVDAGGSALLELLSAAMAKYFGRLKPSEQDEGCDVLFRRTNRPSRGKIVKVLQQYERETRGAIEKATRKTGRHAKPVLLKKDLLRLMKECYEERIAWGQHESFKDSSFAVFVYAQVLRKYSQQKLSEVKFDQILSSALKHSRSPRVHTFARFLGLLSPLTPSDLDYYLDAYSRLKNYCVGLSEDCPAVQLQMAVSVAQSSFEGKLPHREFDSLCRRLASLNTALEGKSGSSIPLEPVLKLFAQTSRRVAELQEKFLTHVYDCVDLHRIGFVELSDFLLLSNRLAAKSLPESEVRRVFEEYADMALDEADEQCRALSFFNFRELALTLQLFTSEACTQFASTADPESALGNFKRNLLTHVSEGKWRLKQLQGARAYALQRYFQTIVEKIEADKDEAATLWLALRLAEEETREEVAEQRADELLPALCRITAGLSRRD